MDAFLDYEEYARSFPSDESLISMLEGMQYLSTESANQTWNRDSSPIRYRLSANSPTQPTTTRKSPASTSEAKAYKRQRASTRRERTEPTICRPHILLFKAPDHERLRQISEHPIISKKIDTLFYEADILTNYGSMEDWRTCICIPSWFRTLPPEDHPSSIRRRARERRAYNP